MKPKRPVIEFLASLPQFQLKMGVHDWYVVDMRNGTSVNVIESDERKYRDVIELRFPGAKDPFTAEAGAYLDLQVMEAACLQGLDQDDRDTLQNAANAAWRKVQEEDWQ